MEAFMAENENLDSKCVEETLVKHAETAWKKQRLAAGCQTFTTLIPLGVGALTLNPLIATALGGVGMIVGQEVCDDVVGLNDALKPPSVEHCCKPEGRGGPDR
jgi:hypothetical protein